MKVSSIKLSGIVAAVCAAAMALAVLPYNQAHANEPKDVPYFDKIVASSNIRNVANLGYTPQDVLFAYDLDAGVQFYEYDNGKIKIQRGELNE